MPSIYVRTAATDGSLGDGVNTIAMTQNLTIGPLDLTDPATLTYTGTSAATVLMLV
jgi:hypothetical protein